MLAVRDHMIADRGADKIIYGKKRGKKPEQKIMPVYLADRKNQQMI
jgi:hypothetical protein